MNYTYIEAWSVLGVMLPEGTQSYEIGHSDCCRFVLTRDPDALLTIIDRQLAIGNFIQNVGPLAQLASNDAVLSSTIEKIQVERRNKIMNQAVMIVEARGETEISLKEPYREFDEFIVSLGAMNDDNEEKLVKIHRSDIEAMKVALALESEDPPRFYKLSSGVYFTDVGNKTIYNIRFSFSGSGFSSAKLTSEGADRISARYNILRQAKDMDKVQRLFSLMADYKNTPLLAFISGWTALEILINKSFETYKEVLTKEPSVRDMFLNRKNKNTKEPDEYTLMDKFILSVLKLFPSDVDDDCEKFSELKKLRNSIHNKEFSEPHLPVSELATFLRKYMHAYMTALGTL
jgi:hypothetical protein